LYLECPPPSRIEIVNQLSRLKNNKTPGEDGIHEELLKNLDEEAIHKIHVVIRKYGLRNNSRKDGVQL